MKTRTFLFAISTAFLFSACHLLDDLQVEKRHYGKGYYVHLRKDRQTEPVAAAQEDNTTPAPPAVEEKPATAGENAPRTSPPAQAPAPAPPASTTEKTSAPENSPPHHATVADASSQETFVMHEHAGPADDGDAAVVLLLLVILAILLPPLAVALKEGLTVRFLLDLIFWLLGFGFIIFVAGGYIYLGIFGLIAIIYALLIVLDVI